MFEPDNIRDGSSTKALLKYDKIEGVVGLLKTDTKKGLNSNSEGDLAQRAQNYGDNKPLVTASKGIWEYIVENFEDEMLQILTLAAAVALVIGVINEGWKEGWLDGLAIFIAVILIVSVTAGNNYIKDQQFRKLNASSENRNINTLRNGKVISMNIYELLVGDVVHIETGEILPVDGLVFKSNNLSADESQVTGETNLVRKAVPTTYDSEERVSPFLLSGSRIMEGTGEMLVLAVGVNSQWGRTKQLIISAGKDEKTPLQEKLAVLADDIGSMGFKAALLTFLAMTIHLLVERIYLGESLWDFTLIQELLNFFIIAVTIVVVAVPEGLPLAVTIALAYSVGKMKDENNLVRYL
jgi:Ca2+ transporting ATPase